jgi:hypothetical protein
MNVGAWLRHLLPPGRYPLNLANDYCGPDLEAFPYQVAGGPVNPKARAWAKAREYERRLALYRWAEQLNDPAAPRYRVLLDDCESAILMTLEAVVQFIGDQLHRERGVDRVEAWLQQKPANDLLFRGLRTLRHLEAHIEARPAASLIIAQVGGSPSIRRRWQLASLQQADLDKLRTPRLKSAELAQWNEMIERDSAAELLRRGLDRVVELVAAAEQEL